ncbi:MAG: hypothetical protein IMW89_06900 [Ktedonobacteraceae bacterium]|nr:hypothetical protein [Ktedonobacteraceae bacterium]
MDRTNLAGRTCQRACVKYRLMPVVLCLTILLLASACGAADRSSPVTPSKVSPDDIAVPTPTVSPTPDMRSHQSASSSRQPTPVPAGTIPAAMPHFFSFGVFNAPGATTVLDEMRAHNGTAFAFRYYFLSGSMNAGQGWEQEGSQSEQSPLAYMQESARHGYMPVFIYTDLCRSASSRPASACAGNRQAQEAQETASLADPRVMKTYYAHWELLLRQVRSFSKPVLIIVEPDLWGHLQRTAGEQADAAHIPASVRSSGYAAATFPDTAQGFAWTLLHMRDTEAPNALLALNAVSWASGIDIASETRSDLDLASLVQKQAQFLKSAGLAGNPANVSRWDVMASDVMGPGGEEAGHSGIWWDRHNRTFPNFTRALSFLSLLCQATHLRMVLWQVPVGNQYFQTMNNTPGHYQDNRAEYILNHVADFANVGIIAVLFGSRTGSSSFDARHDGVTNPSPVVSFQCDLCNSHASAYADDDGGYLRLFIGLYMAYPLAVQ